MDATNKTVRIVGVLFLLQLAAATVSYVALLEPILYSKEFLNEIYENAISVKTAMLFDFACGAAIVSISILLYPILKKYSERIALWYVGLRLIEFVTLMLSGIFLLTLFSVSKNFVIAESEETSYLIYMAKTIRSARGWTQNVNILIFTLAGSMFYLLMYQTKLIPRFISIWGMIAVVLCFISIILSTYGKNTGLLLMMPMGLNEIFLGFWLIFKGFNFSSDNVEYQNSEFENREGLIASVAK